MLTRLAWEVSWWKSNFWENANFCIFLALPTPVIRSQPLPNWTLTGSFACFVFSHWYTRATHLDWVIIDLTINWGRDDDLCADSCQNTQLASLPSVDSSELKIVRITDRQFTDCDVYLDLRPAMKQLIKPIFTFTAKHASWYGGKELAVGHLISAGNMVKRV